MNARSKEALENVLWGSGISGKIQGKLFCMINYLFYKLGAMGATSGATIAVLKNAPVKQYAISTGMSCGVFATTFFCKLYILVYIRYA